MGRVWGPWWITSPPPGENRESTQKGLTSVNGSASHSLPYLGGPATSSGCATLTARPCLACRASPQGLLAQSPPWLFLYIGYQGHPLCKRGFSTLGNTPADCPAWALAHRTSWNWRRTCQSEGSTWRRCLWGRCRAQPEKPLCLLPGPLPRKACAPHGVC